MSADTTVITDEAIARVEANAEPDWIEQARKTVREVAGELDVFTTDDVWAKGLSKPREPRAMGAVMRWAVREGLVERTSLTRRSSEPQSHQCPRRVWRSSLRPEPDVSRTLFNMLMDAA